MKITFFGVFFLIVVLLLGITTTVSYVEDPGGLFKSDQYEDGMAKIILSGHNVANYTNCNERILQKCLVDQSIHPIDVVILGSSRSMQIRNSKFPRKTFFNHAMPSGSLNDFIAILNLYWKKGDNPETVVIGLDPNLLNANSGLIDWKSIQNDYYEGLNRIGVENISHEIFSIRGEPDIKRYSSLFSRQVIFESFYRLFRGVDNMYYPTNIEELNVGIKLHDGSISYPLEFRNVTAKEINESAIQYSNSIPYDLKSYLKMDNELKSEFEAMVKYLKSKNTTVIFFLPPYNPIVYDKFCSEPQFAQVNIIEKYFNEFANIEGIEVIGSYNPYRLNLTTLDFYDGRHPNKECIEKIFNPHIYAVK